MRVVSGAQNGSSGVTRFGASGATAITTGAG
jgi:hypothetical protein